MNQNKILHKASAQQTHILFIWLSCVKQPVHKRLHSINICPELQGQLLSILSFLFTINSFVI